VVCASCCAASYVSAFSGPKYKYPGARSHEMTFVPSCRVFSYPIRPIARYVVCRLCSLCARTVARCFVRFEFINAGFLSMMSFGFCGCRCGGRKRHIFSFRLARKVASVMLMSITGASLLMSNFMRTFAKNRFIVCGLRRLRRRRKPASTHSPISVLCRVECHTYTTHNFSSSVSRSGFRNLCFSCSRICARILCTRCTSSRSLALSSSIDMFRFS
jgi:hypothetical protein